MVVLLVFGTKKLRGAGRDLGEAVRGFKEGAGIGEVKGDAGEKSGSAAAGEPAMKSGPKSDSKSPGV